MFRQKVSIKILIWQVDALLICYYRVYSKIIEMYLLPKL